MDHRVLVIGSRAACERYGVILQATDRARVAWVLSGPEAELPAPFTIFNRLDSARSFRANAAVIATDVPSHVDVAIEAVLSGLHVLIDPPLGITLHGVEMLRYQAQLHSRIVAVGFPDRQFAAFQVLKEALLEQRFGRPLQMVATRGCHLPSEVADYYHTDYALHLRGGGAVQHALSHLMNLGEWLLGPVNRLVADADRLALAEVTVEDTAHVLARHGRMLAVYALHQHQAARETCITVNCAGGTVRAQLPENRLLWMTEPNGLWSEQDFDTMEPNAAQVEQVQQFLNAIEGRPARLCTLDQGLQTLRVCRAVLSSVQQKVWVGGEPEA